MHFKALFALFICVFLLSTKTIFAEKSYSVTYASFQDTNQIDGTESSITFENGILYLSQNEDVIRDFIDYKERNIVSIINSQNTLFKLLIPFDSLLKPDFKNEVDTILGFHCRLATFMYFSNTIDVWFTEDAGFPGSPYKQFLPTEKALALKIIVNGNRDLRAIKIERAKKDISLEFPVQEAKASSDAEFEELKIKSRYTQVMVFKNEKVNFDTSLEIPSLEKPEINKTYRFSKGTVILKRIKMPESFTQGSFVFAKLTCWSEGDAYDRTGSIFIIPDSDKEISMLDALQGGIDKLPKFVGADEKEYQGFHSTENYNTPIELMRFFTTFGAGHFNTKREINNYNWEENATYKADVTGFIPVNQEYVWIGAFIGNYSNEGHRINLELDFYPGFESDSNTHQFLQPLFFTVNVMEMSGQSYPELFAKDSLTVSFEIPEYVSNLNLIYTTTGHGGWGGGDEFNPKLNQLFIDGDEVYKCIPWRSDCATYRMLNPASGNFGNGMSSSDLSRSNWCPGTMTAPYIIPLENLKPGRHIMKIAIDQGKPEGSSFSHWGVSGFLTGTLSTD